MDIDGLGEKQVATLLDRGLVRVAGDFYRLTEDQLTALDGYGEVSARNLVASIQASQDRPFGIVLFALDRGRRLCHRPQPRGPVPHDRRPAGRHARADRRRPASARSAQLDPDQLADEQMRALIADLQRSGCGSSRRSRRPARACSATRRSCSPARCRTSRASRRRSGSWPPGARSPARVAQDFVPGRGRGAGLEAGEGREARGAGDRRGRAGGAARGTGRRRRRRAGVRRAAILLVILAAGCGGSSERRDAQDATRPRARSRPSSGPGPPPRAASGSGRAWS